MTTLLNPSENNTNTTTSTFTINKPEEYISIIEYLDKHDITHLFLSGSLGTGKTTLVKARADKLLNKQTLVKSPTYTYMNIYHDTLLHIDMRRINQPEQLQELGILEAIEKYPYVAIERPKRKNLYLQPEKTAMIEMKLGEDGKRECEVTIFSD